MSTMGTILLATLLSVILQATTLLLDEVSPSCNLNASKHYVVVIASEGLGFGPQASEGFGGSSFTVNFVTDLCQFF